MLLQLLFLLPPWRCCSRCLSSFVAFLLLLTLRPTEVVGDIQRYVGRSLQRILAGNIVIFKIVVVAAVVAAAVVVAVVVGSVVVVVFAAVTDKRFFIFM